jgi:DNA-directed RNA polymerase specialized sigma24 family protein
MSLNRLPDDPIDALAAIARTGTRRPDLERHIVGAARREGFSWQGISDALDLPVESVFATFATDPRDTPFG